ncbi:Putative metal-dependent membrane protease [Rheinheimera sp. A13L]|nr:Putative metal-dependent membrane protease [Rheinheimera sp. A13L]
MIAVVLVVFCLFRVEPVAQTIQLFYYYIYSDLNINVDSAQQEALLLQMKVVLYPLIALIGLFFLYSQYQSYSTLFRLKDMNQLRFASSSRLTSLASITAFFMLVVAVALLCSQSVDSHDRQWFDFRGCVTLYFFVTVIFGVFSLSGFNVHQFRLNTALRFNPNEKWLYWLVLLLITYIIQFAFYLTLSIVSPVTIDVYRAETSVTVVDHLMISLIMSAVLAPVAEELLFRGYLQTKLKSFLPYIWPRILIVALPFTLMHLQYSYGLIFVFVSALLYGWAREKANSVYPAIFLHAVSNTIAVLTIYFR